jgi:hypothetical protein
LRFFFLAHLDEMEVTLVLESDENTESIVRFECIGDEVGIVGYSNSRLAASPTRLLVIRPASLAQSSREVFVDVGSVVAIVFDVVGAEVVLQDVVGHDDAIVKIPLISYVKQQKRCSKDCTTDSSHAPSSATGIMVSYSRHQVISYCNNASITRSHSS